MRLYARDLVYMLGLPCGHNMCRHTTCVGHVLHIEFPKCMVMLCHTRHLVSNYMLPTYAVIWILSGIANETHACNIIWPMGMIHLFMECSTHTAWQDTWQLHAVVRLPDPYHVMEALSFILVSQACAWHIQRPSVMCWKVGQSFLHNVLCPASQFSGS